MVSATILGLFEVVGIFFFGVSISWLLFQILRTKTQHTPPSKQDRKSPERSKDIRLAVEQTRLDVAATKLRTEQIRLRALETRAGVVGGGKHNGNNRTVDDN